MEQGERLYVIGANDAEVTPVKGSNVDRAESLRYRDDDGVGGAQGQA